ncbi:hypothetical protein [Deinococcus aquaticus]|uniref:hypothetical protein n=1 Tax=Deinococcus aquaticus TaxID=328692 RepID=UPI003F46E548
MSGSLSIMGSIKRIGINYFSIGVLAVLVFSSFYSILKIKELREHAYKIIPLVLLGFLPILYQIVEIILGNYNLNVSYVFKFLPYATIVFLIILIKNQNLLSIELIVRLVAAIIALRSISVFVFPEVAVQNSFIKQYGYIDSFYVYEYINGIPRVFFPGLALVILSIFIASRNFLIEKTSVVRVLEILILFLCLLIGLTRGIIIISVFLLSIMIVIYFFIKKVEIDRGKIILGFFLLSIGILSLPFLTRAIPFDELYQSDRFSLGTDNISWRQAQVDIAINQIRTPKELIFGIGPNATIPSDPLSQDYYSQTNELHFSYVSLFWSFGIFGIVLFFMSTIGIFFLGKSKIFYQTYLYPWLFAFVSILIIGVYNPTVTLTDWNMAIVLIYSVLLINIKGGAENKI